MDDQPLIQHCHTPQCKTCKNNQLDTNVEFYSNLNKKLHTINFSQNCKTNLNIYLISCKHEQCSLKYVGRTCQALCRRLAGHRANITAGTEGPAMLHHFTKVHKPSDMIIKAIEICSKNNIIERENHWIAELNTSFPYGLNDRIEDTVIKDAYNHTLNNSTINKAVYETFNKTPSKRSKRGQSHHNKTQQHNTFDPATYMNTNILTNVAHKGLFVNHVRTQIMRLNKNNTKLLFLHLCVAINEHNDYFHQYNSNRYSSYLAYLCKDIAFAKLKAMYPKKKIVQKTPSFIVVNFSNKLMNNINLNKVFHDKHLLSLFPTTDKPTLGTPTVTFKYTSTIRSQITNYRQVIQDGTTPTQCDCHNHDERFKVDNHVFTGDLAIIRNDELRTLMKKGLNFRETPPPSKDTAFESIKDSINQYVQHCSEATKTPISSFTPWKMEFMHRSKLQIDKLKSKNFNNTLTKSKNRNELEKLKNKWVFTPTDKAANNITIVCKKHYMDLLDEEIFNSGNFIKSNESTISILDNHTKYLSKFNLVTKPKIPFLYWTAKLHKTPYSQRFITSGRNCTTQPLSILVGYCLKTVLNIIRNNAKFHRKKTNVNKCFIIDNRNSVIRHINNCNRNNNTSSVSTYDFKTLYTSIPHDKLKRTLASIIRSAFNSRRKKFISISGKIATLTDSRKSTFSFSLQQLIECINFLIDNSYIMYKGELYRQTIGIPMGTNCAPYLANIFLHYYEAAYIEDVNNSDVTSKLDNMFRYQDDCIIFNDDGLLGQIWSNIYPVEMQLESTSSNNTCTFLDLSICLINGKIQYKSYDKRNDFNFTIINYPNLNGNIPTGPSYGVFSSQLIRFCDINSKLNEFQDDVQILIKKLIKQNFKLKVLRSKFLQFYKKNFLRWSKFGYDIARLADIFFQM